VPRFELGDATLAFAVSGEQPDDVPDDLPRDERTGGPAVVQLHGLTSSRARDDLLGLDLGRGLRGHRLLRYDARGHGLSTGSADPRSYRWTRLADDLLALLDHVFPGERVHGVGPSMGTATLLHAALRDRTRFTGLTLVTPPTAWETRRAQAEVYEWHASLVERRGLAAFVALGSDAPQPPALVGAPVTQPSVSGELLPSILRGAAASDLPSPAAVATLRVPALVLAWRGDPSHPTATATRLHELISGSHLVTASSPDDVRTWPGIIGEHVREHVTLGVPAG